MGKKAGVLALQGDVERHIRSLARAGMQVSYVRYPEQLKEVDALVIPGGETTTFTKLMNETGLFEAIQQFGQQRPVMGTCAGLIVLARRIVKDTVKTLNLIDIEVERNGYGRQRDSFIGRLDIPVFNQNPYFEGFFIRAPRIRVLGKSVEPCGYFGEEVVMARSGLILVTTFHPELTKDLRIHKYFLNMAGNKKGDV